MPNAERKTPAHPSIPRAALSELAALYSSLGSDVAATAVRCDLRGLCCDFDRSGHLLFSTDLEVAFARAHGAARIPDAPLSSCPWFTSGKCKLREGRPLGCRVYFCDPGYADKMSELSERYHREVRAIHDRHGIEYRYDRFVRRIREPVP